VYEVTERKLLREMEPWVRQGYSNCQGKQTGKSRGYAFVEHEHEEDMVGVPRSRCRLKIEGRQAQVWNAGIPCPHGRRDDQRWSRWNTLGGKHENVTRPKV
jgi:hypothetical protein